MASDYQATVSALADPSMDAQRRARLLALCEQAEATMQRELAELDLLIEQYYAARRAALRRYFLALRDGILDNDPDGITRELEKIASVFGGSLNYVDLDEFEMFMLDRGRPVTLAFS